jgi:GPH family glycoside/pentoside/hexuronide:cation symporter
MGKINWFKRSADPGDMLCVGERFSYAFANGGIAVPYILTIAYMSYYYTDVVGVPAAIVGTLLLLSRVFDGITDVLMGTIIDKTRSKLGKARIWLFIMAIPSALALILAFSVPEGLTDFRLYLFIYLTYNLATSVTYTAVYISGWTLNNLLTENSKEHAKSGILFQIVGASVVMTIQYTFIRIVTFFGDDRKAWTSATAIFALVGAAMMIISAFNIRERVALKIEEVKIPIKERLRALFHNKYWVTFVFSWLVAEIQWTLIGSGGLYYATHILGDVNKYSVIGTTQTISWISILLAATWLIKKLKPKNLWVLGSVLILTGSVIQIFVAQAWGLVIVCEVIKGIGMGCNISSQGAIMADSVDFSRRKFGFDVSGVGNAGISFGAKFGGGIGGVMIGGVLAWFGYDGTAAVQSSNALLGVKVVYLGLLILFSLINILLMSRFDLYKKIKWDMK